MTKISEERMFSKGEVINSTSYQYQVTLFMDLLQAKEAKYKSAVEKYGSNKPFVEELNREIDFLADFINKTFDFNEQIIKRLTQRESDLTSFKILYDQQSNFITTMCQKDEQFLSDYMRYVIVGVNSSDIKPK
jgi:hypothetical protein